MQLKLIVGLFVLCSVLMPLCSASLRAEDIVKDGRTNEAEYAAKSDVVLPEDVQRAKGANGGGGGPGSIVRQPPAQKGDATPRKMDSLSSTTMAVCCSFYVILFLI